MYVSAKYYIVQSKVQVKVQSMVQVNIVKFKFSVKFSNERTWSDTIIKQATPPPPHHQTFLNSISTDFKEFSVKDFFQCEN